MMAAADLASKELTKQSPSKQTELRTSKEKLFSLEDELTIISGCLAQGIDFNPDKAELGKQEDFTFTLPFRANRSGEHIPVSKRKVDNIGFNYIFLVNSMNELAVETLRHGTSQLLNPILLQPSYDTVSSLFAEEIRQFTNEVVRLYADQLYGNRVPAENSYSISLELKARSDFFFALIKEMMERPANTGNSTPGEEILETYRGSDNYLSQVVDELKTMIDEKARKRKKQPTLDEVLHAYLDQHPEITALRSEVEPNTTTLELILLSMALHSKKSNLFFILRYLDRLLRIFSNHNVMGQYNPETGDIDVLTAQSPEWKKFIRLRAGMNGALLGISPFLPLPFSALIGCLVLYRSIRNGKYIQHFEEAMQRESMDTYAHEFIHKLSAYTTSDGEEAKVGFLRFHRKRQEES